MIIKDDHPRSLMRRQVLKQLSALAGLIFISPLNVQAKATEQRERIIPSSGETLPVMGLGTARTFDVGNVLGVLAPLREVMRLFVEQGGRLVDSSPMYGRAEAVVGDLVADLGIGDKLFYATKVWTTGRLQGIEQIESSFRLMRTPVIDLMQVHNLVDTQTQLTTIRERMKEKRIRYVGVTHYSSGAFDELEQLMREEKIDFVQVPYSIANRAAEKRLIPAAADQGVALIAHRNFEKGRLFQKVRGKPLPKWADEFDCQSWGNFFLKYLIGDPRVTSVIPATRKPWHLTDNMHAGLGRLPDDKLRRRMVRLIDEL